MYEILESSIRDTYGSVVWSHKIQEKQADIYSSQYKFLEIARIAASALTTVGIGTLFFENCIVVKVISAIISLASTFVSVFFKSFDLVNMVGQHKQAANSLLCIRDELKLLLLHIRLESKSEQEMLTQYEVLVRKLDDIYKSAPTTTDKAVELARRALQIDKDNDITDREIDLSLPIALRKEIIQ